MEDMNVQKKQLSKEGLEKYQEELNFLKEVRRLEIAAKIKDAREQGDLSENAEYDAAKDEQRENEIRIEQIEEIIKNAVVVDKADLKRGTIGVGSHVKLYDINEDEEIEYDIVGASEANSLEGKISNESPLGKALLGKKKGDIVEVKLVPRGKLKLEVRKVS